MESLEKDWIEYPVIHLDLNAKKFDTENDLIRLIDRQLLVYEAQYGSCSSDETIDDRLVTLIRLAAEKTGQRVVILVDEYDKPMLQAIGREELQEEYRNTLKAFYGVMKSMDGYIKFAMLTGVTKFGKVSVFSDLNNLNDISMWNQYIDICGVSDQELHDNLEVELSEFADARGMAYKMKYVLHCVNTMMVTILLIIPLACIIRLVFSMHSYVMNLAAIGSKPVHLPI